MSEESKPQIVEIVIIKKETPLKIGDLIYTLREMDGVDLGQWRASMSGRAKMNANGQVVGLTTYTGVEAELISKCLFTPQGQAVPKETITNWSVSAQQQLVKMCEDLNGLTKEAAEKEKNA